MLGHTPRWQRPEALLPTVARERKGRKTPVEQLPCAGHKTV